MYNKLRNELKTFYWLIVVTAAINAVTVLMAETSVNNMVFFHLYTYVEFGFISVLFYQLSADRNWRFLIKLFIAGFLLFSIVNVIYFESLLGFNSNQRYLEGIMILTMCVGYFAQLMKKAEHIYLERHPFFWLTSGFLIYFAGTLILFLFQSKLQAWQGRDYWELYGILAIWLNFAYFMSLWTGKKV